MEALGMRVNVAMQQWGSEANCIGSNLIIQEKKQTAPGVLCRASSGAIAPHQPLEGLY
eukprot:CAMPEP_0174374294 /NCGR_PEP_ID=MMETSP0811_2-20130205/110357_1 /TAXON_ID=73025 ORGANISM="Eutreptiella gymnastica-like, Strain CCMP1594" /NCGR_SAMPLE_ID=MMETSP0811_2 /ASSEMBLY_ACC=CAM_ASM_000667 /LENGTH=57 /DNA_ID=CAMNT_0015523477 /DNA_START=190 /DNA_END=363 /DNA_ORIENTATION=+